MIVIHPVISLAPATGERVADFQTRVRAYKSSNTKQPVTPHAAPTSDNYEPDASQVRGDKYVARRCATVKIGTRPALPIAARSRNRAAEYRVEHQCVQEREEDGCEKH